MVDKIKTDIVIPDLIRDLIDLDSRLRGNDGSGEHG